LNPSNCDTATVTVTVSAATIDAVADTTAPINGINGGDAGIDVLDNDLLNGVAVVATDVVITSTPTGPLTVNTDGLVTVDADTAAGDYDIDYTICEILNPNNCDTATVTVTVSTATILAVDDSPTTVVDGFEGAEAVVNVLDNDTLNGNVVVFSEVTLTLINADSGLILNGDGTVDVASCTPEGIYELEYQLCEVLNPTNCDTATVTINVEDTTAPVIDALPLESTIECSDELVFAQATVSDICNQDFTLTFEDVTTEGKCVSSYSVTRTWTVTDAFGNSSEATQTITVEDTTAPVIDVLPEMSTIECSDELVFSEATGSDNCDQEFELTSADVTTEGECLGSYSVTRTWTATDACGNSSEATQTINVEDTTAPVIDALPEMSTIECSEEMIFSEATGSDNCDQEFSLTSADVTTDGECLGSYSVTRTWTATDACGNSSEASQTINIEDTTAPVMTTQARGETVEADGEGNLEIFKNWRDSHGGAEAADACSAITWSHNFTNIVYICGKTASVDVIFTATDACGNAASTTATFSIEDSLGPVVSASSVPDIIVECGDDTSIEALGVAVFNDANSDVVVTYSDSFEVNSGAPDNIIRTWVATDACGNEQVAIQSITVNDTTLPTISVPGPITVECTEEVSSQVTGVATATDGCGEVTITESDSVVENCGNSKVITRTWTATDDSGNAVTGEQIITVVDTTPPTIIDFPESEITVECSDIPNAAEISGVDNCSSNITTKFEEDILEVDSAGNYQIIRVWVLVDECDNESSFVQTINVTPVVEVDADAIDYCITEVPVDLLTFLSNVSDTTGTWSDDDNSGAVSGSELDPSKLSEGSEYSFTYTSGTDCVSKQTFTIHATNDCFVAPCESPDGIEISKVVTANNDGINDTFVISDVESCGFTSAVIIFNRWGKMVYESDNYHNNWAGYNEGGGPSVGSGNKLPTGTYYYIVNVVGSGYAPITGYIYLGTN